MKHRLMVLMLAALAVLVVQPSWADWQEVADEQVAADESEEAEEVEDNPAWDEYAFELDYADGSGELSFHELARAGQPFVIFFWLTDCPVCHLQLPYIQRFDKMIKDNDLDIRVVSINLDERVKDCVDFAAEKKLTFELLFDARARKTDKGYHLRDIGTPVAYVFDADGLVVDYLTGFRGQFAKNVLQMLDMEEPAG